MLGLLPVPGRVDLVVASELLEAVRVVQAGMTSPERTLLVTSTARTLTTAEKMPLGDGRFDSALLLEVARRHSREVVAFDMARAAREAGTVVSAVMFGAVAASGVLPFARDACEAVIEGDDRAAMASRAGFARGVRGDGCDARRGMRRAATAAAAPVARARRDPRGVSRGDSRRSSRSATRASLEFQDRAYARALPRARRAGARGGAGRRSGRRARTSR